MPQNEFNFTPHPKLAVDGWQNNLRDKDQLMPCIASRNQLSIHGLKKKVMDEKGEDSGKREFLGFGIWDSSVGLFIRGGWDEPIKEYPPAEKMLVKMLTPEAPKPVDILS